MHLSILLPTVRRPEMLRSALHSIAAQTRADLISEIIVSENSEDTRSREVCAEFPSLPLKWIKRSPQLPPYAHFRALGEHATAPWIAWHGDDDLWSQYHLQEASRCLETHPEAIGFVPNFLFVRNESCRAVVPTQQTVEGIRSGTHRDLQNEQMLSAERMFIETLVHVPFNFWSLVARAEPTRLSLQRWNENSGWDVDRLFFWDLARRGPIVHSRETTMFHRTHLSSTGAGYHLNREAWCEASASHTRQLIKEAEAAGMQPRQLWETEWSQMNPEQRGFTVVNALPGTLDALRGVWGKQCCAIPEQPLIMKGLRNLSPPLLWNFLRSFKHKPASAPLERPPLNSPPA